MLPCIDTATWLSGANNTSTSSMALHGCRNGCACMHGRHWTDAHVALHGCRDGIANVHRWPCTAAQMALHRCTNGNAHASDLQIIVVGVLSQAPVEEGPGEVVHSILLAGDGLVHNLSHHVVVQEVVQMTLHWVRLKQELLVVLLARRVAHQHTPAVRAGGAQGQQRAGKLLVAFCLTRCMHTEELHKQLPMSAELD